MTKCSKLKCQMEPPAASKWFHCNVLNILTYFIWREQTSIEDCCLSVCLFVVWCSLTVVLTSISSEKIHFQRKRSFVIITSLLYKHCSSHTISMWEITQVFWRKRLSNMHNNWASQMTTLTHFGCSIFLWNKSLFPSKSKGPPPQKKKQKVILVIP